MILVAIVVLWLTKGKTAVVMSHGHGRERRMKQLRRLERLHKQRRCLEQQQEEQRRLEHEFQMPGMTGPKWEPAMAYMRHVHKLVIAFIKK